MLYVSAQTTYTESGNAYGLDLTGSKDGGHAWSDFDNDGLIDVLVLENVRNANTKSFLMRQSPAGTFTNVQTTLAPGMLGDWAERQAVWGDINSDGRPDFMINSYGASTTRVAIQIFIQNPSGTFGDGIGGTTPITVGQNVNETITIADLNVEGTGFFDFEGDGDLDIFFDNHQFGIELLRNNHIDHTTHTVTNPTPAGLFTHITPGNGAGVVEYGLNQSATDGDYGSAADVNDDGWVDIFMRKRDENDFFLNQGGSFTNGADLAQADNSNKGGNGLWDLDNDGDLDAVWTENGLNQIFRNDGPGVWTPLGAITFPGLPQPSNTDRGTSSAVIDALAGGDVDNDGDIDILFVGTGRSYLFINQLNSPTPAPGLIGSGTAMTFSLDAEVFNSGQNGEGTTMVDIDDDGDLDIYMSIRGRNRLYINNLPVANRNNHLIIDVTEDRGANGSTGGVPERVAIGTNILIRDCNGNIISGLRQVNGVFGHGTQSPEAVHFGLPLGEGETYVIEVRYPNFYDPVDGVSRLIGTLIATPSTISGTNHYTINSTQAELSENINAPDAVDDKKTVPIGTSVSVQLSLFDNDFDADGHSFFIESVVQPTAGSVVIDDANAGLVTYTYSAGTLFPGTTFDYNISDSPVGLCPALGKSDTATVTIYEPCADPSGLDTDGDGINDICDLDDDNDGILDCDESSDSINAYFGWSLNSPPSNLSMDYMNDSDVTNWLLSGTEDYTWSGIDTSPVGSTFHIYDIPSANLGEAVANNNYYQVGFTTGELINPELINVTSGWYQPSNGDSYYMSMAISDDAFVTSEMVSTDVFVTDPGGTVYAQFDLLESSSYKLEPNTTYTLRVFIYGQIDDNAQNISYFDDLTFNIKACKSINSDFDSDFDHLDTDSDNDGCSDADEAYILTLSDADPDNNGIYGSGTPTVDNSGLVTTAAYFSPNEFYLNINGNTCVDTDNDGVPNVFDLDDDNDGILDTVEHPKTVLWVLNGTITNDQQNTINKITSLGYTVTVADDNDSQDANNYSVTYVHPTVNSGTAYANIANLATTTKGVITSENALFDEIFGTSGTSGNQIASEINIINNSHPITANLSLGNLNIGDGSYHVQNVVTGTKLGEHPNGNANLIAWNIGESMDTGIAPGRRVAAPHTSYNGGLNSAGEDLLINAIIWAWGLDTDGNGINDDLDSDSDGDGCSDADEGYGIATADSDDNGMYGTGNPAVNTDGTVIAASYTAPNDANNNSIYDFQEVGVAPSISTQPTNLNICPGCSGSFSVAATNADTFQCQLFNGITWVDLTDSGIYTGTNTHTLSIINASSSDSPNQYRVLLYNSNYSCTILTSSVVVLTVNVSTVITNRRITYRTNKN